MKHVLFGVCGLLCAASLATAGELSHDAYGASANLTSVAPSNPNVQAEQCQATDNDNITPGNGVACSSDGGFTTTDNGQAREWAALGATSVAQVRFGIEICRDATGQGRPCSIEVRLYSAPSFPTFGSAVLLSTANMDIPDGTAGQIFTADFPNVAIPGGTNLVAEVWNADFTNQWGLFPGSNAAGQSAPSYVRSTACGLTNWTDLAGIGFPTDDLIICFSDEGGNGGCQYAIKKSKPKKGCDACPKKGDTYASGDACENVKDCPKKLKIAKLDCPGGGPGFCKGVKGKASDCTP